MADRVIFNCKDCKRLVKADSSSALDIEQRCKECFNAQEMGELTK